MMSSLHPRLEIGSMRRLSGLALRQDLIAGGIFSLIFIFPTAALGDVLGHLSISPGAMWFHLSRCLPRIIQMTIYPSFARGLAQRFSWDGDRCNTKFSGRAQREPSWRSFVSWVAGRCMRVGLR